MGTHVNPRSTMGGEGDDENNKKLLQQFIEMMGLGDQSLPGRMKQVEQRMDSFMNVLGRVFDLNWDKPDDRTVLISIRESIMFSAKLQNMKEPTFEQVIDHVKKSIKSEDARAKNVMSYVRLVLAGLVGIIFTIIATRLGLK